MNHFKDAAKNWDTPQKKERNFILAQRIALLLNREHSYELMDFGCGTGLLAEALTKTSKIVRIVGVDSVEEMIQEFETKFQSFPYVEGIRLNIEKEELSHSIGQFDLIVSAMAFHHLEYPLKTLKKFKNYLKDGGRVFLIDLDQEDGSFHSDPKTMGVFHSGFSEALRDQWCIEAGYKSVVHDKVLEIAKNERVYPVIMSAYTI